MQRKTYLCYPMWIFELFEWVDGLNISLNCSISKFLEVILAWAASLGFEQCYSWIELSSVMLWTRRSFKLNMKSPNPVTIWRCRMGQHFDCQAAIASHGFQMSDTSENIAGWISRPPSTFPQSQKKLWNCHRVILAVVGCHVNEGNLGCKNLFFQNPTAREMWCLQTQTQLCFW